MAVAHVTLELLPLLLAWAMVLPKVLAWSVIVGAGDMEATTGANMS